MLKQGKHEDRIRSYILAQLSMSPMVFFKKMRSLWCFGILLNIFSFLFMFISFYIPLEINKENELVIVRIDGKKIEQPTDARRAALIDNTLQRIKVRSAAEDLPHE